MSYFSRCFFVIFIVAYSSTEAIENVEAYKNVIAFPKASPVCKNLLKVKQFKSNTKAPVVVLEKKPSPPYAAPSDFINEFDTVDLYVYITPSKMDGSRPTFSSRDLGHWRVIQEVGFPLSANRLFILKALAGPRFINFASDSPSSIKSYTALDVSLEAQIFLQIVKFLLNINKTKQALITRSVLTSLVDSRVSNQLSALLDLWETELDVDIELKSKIRDKINDPRLDLRRDDHFRELILSIVSLISNSHLREKKDYDQSLWSLVSILEKNAIYPYEF